MQASSAPDINHSNNRHSPYSLHPLGSEEKIAVGIFKEVWKTVVTLLSDAGRKFLLNQLDQDLKDHLRQDAGMKVDTCEKQAAESRRNLEKERP